MSTQKDPPLGFVLNLLDPVGTDLGLGLEHYETHSKEDEIRLYERTQELRELKQGWCDGKGEPLPSSGLTRVEYAILLLLVMGTPLPRLYPTLEGELEAEWSFGSWEISATFSLKDPVRAYLHAVHVVTQEDEECTEEDTRDDRTDWAARMSVFISKYRLKGDR